MRYLLQSLLVRYWSDVVQMLVAQLFNILYGSQLHHLLDEPIGVDEVAV